MWRKFIYHNKATCGSFQKGAHKVRWTNQQRHLICNCCQVEKFGNVDIFNGATIDKYHYFIVIKKP
jgi:hypothetical protein